MDEPGARFILVFTLCVACLPWCTALGSTPSTPPAAENPDVLIREFREVWDLLGQNRRYSEEAYQKIVDRAREMIVRLGDLGTPGHELFIELLPRSNRIVRGTTRHRMPDVRLKPAMIEILARDNVRAAVPALKRLLLDGWDLVYPDVFTDSNGRGAYRPIPESAIRALRKLGDYSVIPRLRAAFEKGFERRWRGDSRLRSHLEVLVRFGDNAYVEKFLIGQLGSESCRQASTAAYLAARVPGGLMIPHLIAYMERTSDPTAQWSLELITRREYLGVSSWKAWWELNRGRSSDDWIDLSPTHADGARWAELLIDLLEEYYVRVDPLIWYRGRPPHLLQPGEVSLDVARKAYVLGIEDAIVDYLLTRVKDQSIAGHCPTWYSCDGIPVTGASGYNCLPGRGVASANRARTAKVGVNAWRFLRDLNCLVVDMQAEEVACLTR